MTTSSGVLNLDSLILSDDEKEVPLVVISQGDDKIDEISESPNSDYEIMAQECVASADKVLSEANAERKEKNRRINQARMEKQKEIEDKQKGFVKKSTTKSEAVIQLSKPNSASGKITGIISSRNNAASATSATKELTLKNSLDSSSNKKSCNSKKCKITKKPLLNSTTVTESSDIAPKNRNITIQDFDVSSTDTYSDYESDSDMDLDRTDLQFLKKQPKLFTVRHLNDVSNLDVDQMFDSDSSESENKDDQKRCYYSAEKSASAKRRYKSNYLNKRRSRFKSKGQEQTLSGGVEGSVTSSVRDLDFLCPSALAESKHMNKKSNYRENNTEKNRSDLKTKFRQNNPSNDYSRNKNECSDFGKNNSRPSHFGKNRAGSSDFGRNRAGSSNFGRNNAKNFNSTSQFEKTLEELDDIVILSEVHLKPNSVNNDQFHLNNLESDTFPTNLKSKFNKESKLEASTSEGISDFKLDHILSKDIDQSILDDCTFQSVGDFQLDDVKSKKENCKSEELGERFEPDPIIGGYVACASVEKSSESFKLKPEGKSKADDKSDELFKFEKEAGSSDDEIDWKAVMENRNKVAVPPKLVLSSDSEDIDFNAIIRSKRPPEVKPDVASATQVALRNESDSSDLESQFNSCLAQLNKK